MGEPITGRLSYGVVGATNPAETEWLGRPAGYRTHESTVWIGTGDDVWRAATDSVLGWKVKTRSGFEVAARDGGDPRVAAGREYALTARLGPLSVHEPVRVVAVIDMPDRCGFAYGTLEGHPVSGEEAFVVHRGPDDTVMLTLRSLTRAPRGRWILAYPASLAAQRWYRRRYRRALVQRPAGR